MESLYHYAIWGLLFIFGDRFAVAETYHPYGPRMCEGLRPTFYRNTTFHTDNLTCVVESYQQSSWKKICDGQSISSSAECKERFKVIRTRKGQPACVPVCTEQPLQGLLLAVLRKAPTENIFKLSLASRRADNYTLIRQIGNSEDMACSNLEKKIYLVNDQRSQIRVWPLGQKTAKVLITSNISNVYAVAVDGKRKLLFVIIDRGIGVVNETAKPLTIQKITITWNMMYKTIVLDTERQLIFVSCYSRILQTSYVGGKPKTLYKGHLISGFACDSNGYLYFVTLRALMTMSNSGAYKRLVKEMRHDVWMIQVYHDIVYVAVKLRGEILAVEPENGNILWSHTIFPVKNDFLFCVLTLI